VARKALVMSATGEEEKQVLGTERQPNKIITLHTVEKLTVKKPVTKLFAFFNTNSIMLRTVARGRSVT
jgi:hypothetical protein